MIHATIWMDLTDIMLSEKSERQEYIPYDSIYMKFKTGKTNM